MAISIVAPTILTKNPTEYKEIVQKYNAFTKRAHIDISDGTLSPDVTVSETATWWPKGWQVDIHMMTANPAAHVDNLIKLHPNLVIFHAEAKDDLLPIFDTLKQNGMKVGVALVKSVYPPSIKAVLEAADHAMIFSGEMGKYGGNADILLLEKIRRTRILKLDSDDQEWLDDVEIDNRQAMEMADTYSQITTGVMDAFANVISNNMNVAMKKLAVINLVMMAPTFVTSFFGMNFKLPFDTLNGYIPVSIATLICVLSVMLSWWLLSFNKTARTLKKVKKAKKRKKS